MSVEIDRLREQIEEADNQSRAYVSKALREHRTGSSGATCSMYATLALAAETRAARLQQALRDRGAVA